jgi:hypothetical protein
MILHLQLKIFFDQQTFFEETVRKLLPGLICEECAFFDPWKIEVYF